jgi:hypothetical protein
MAIKVRREERGKIERGSFKLFLMKDRGPGPSACGKVETRYSHAGV